MRAFILLGLALGSPRTAVDDASDLRAIMERGMSKDAKPAPEPIATSVNYDEQAQEVDGELAEAAKMKAMFAPKKKVDEKEQSRRAAEFFAKLHSGSFGKVHDTAVPDVVSRLRGSSMPSMPATADAASDDMSDILGDDDSSSKSGAWSAVDKLMHAQRPMP